MHIHFKGYLAENLFLPLKESFLPEVMSQHRKIWIVVSAALALLAVCFAIKRYGSSPSIVEDHDKPIPSPIILKKEEQDTPLDNQRKCIASTNGSKPKRVPMIYSQPKLLSWSEEGVIEDKEEANEEPFDPPKDDVVLLLEPSSLPQDEEESQSIVDPSDTPKQNTDREEILEQIGILSQQIVAEQTKMFDKKDEIRPLRLSLDKKQMELSQILEEIEDLTSEGTGSILVKELSFQPDSDLTLPSGQKLKAKDYMGTLDVVLNIDAEFILISEEEAQTRIPAEGEFLLFITGQRYHLKGAICTARRNKDYRFTTEWHGDGVFPEIKMFWLTSKEECNEKEIIDRQSQVETLRSEISNMKHECSSLEQEVKASKLEIERLSQLLGENRAKLDVV